MKLSLTGNEPFARSSINPSEQVVRALSQEQIAGIGIRAAIGAIQSSKEKNG